MGSLNSKHPLMSQLAGQDNNQRNLPWEEAEDEEKIRRLLKAVQTLTNAYNTLRGSNQREFDQLRNHKHNSHGEVVVESVLSNSRNYQGEMAVASEPTIWLEGLPDFDDSDDEKTYTSRS
jgi:hypothetical protein